MAQLPPVNQTIVRDLFVRVNSGTLGASWTSFSDVINTATIGITSNAALVQTLDGNSASFYNVGAFTPNQYAQCLLGGPTGTLTHGGGPIVRANANGYYRFFVNKNQTVNGAQILKCVNGVAAGLATASSVAVTASSLLRIEIITISPNTYSINCYMDGVLVVSFTDTEPLLANGNPGVCNYQATSTTACPCTAFEGGNLIWTRRGTAIPVGATGAQEPAVLYEAGPKILVANADGKIWKMWFGVGWFTGNSIYYAESNDGITWTQYVSNPVLSDGANMIGHAFTMKYKSIYYTFACTSAQTPSPMNRWSSPDGITWTKTDLSVLPLGTAGQFDDGGLFNPVVWVQSGTWYMLYNGSHVGNATYAMGLATSPDGITWTRYAGNPVIATAGTAAEGKTVVFDGSTYYLWGFQSPTGNLPTDIAVWTSPDLHTWTPAPNNPIYLRVLADEGANKPVDGQVADPCLIELNGTTYMFYDTTDLQAALHSHINVATVPFTLLQLTRMVFKTTAFSEADDRTYGVFPNISHDVSGTLIDDIPAQPSVIAPVDSRASGWKPTDSREPANIPTNSRTPGVNGPGN